MEEKSTRTQVWRFVLSIPIIWAAIVALGALSFLFWGEFTFRAYSDRVFWGGIAAIVVGGFVAVSALGAYGTLGTPSVLTAGADARIAHERIWEYMKTNAGRYMFTFRMFLAGALCIATSALVEVLSR